MEKYGFSSVSMLIRLFQADAHLIVYKKYHSIQLNFQYIFLFFFFNRITQTNGALNANNTNIYWKKTMKKGKATMKEK